MGRSGKIDAVVIGVGGFLGVGERYDAVPYNEIKWIDQPRGSTATTGTSSRSDARRPYPDHAVLNTTKDQLRATSEFKFAADRR